MKNYLTSMFGKWCIGVAIALFANLSLQAQTVFTTLAWQGDTTFVGAIQDNGMPYYVASFDIGKDYANSNYTVSVDYPEYIEVKTDLRAQPTNEEIVVTTEVAVSARQGILYVKVLPYIMRNGKTLRLTSFKLTLHKAVKRIITRQSVSMPPNTNPLETGKWVKIAVNETGMHKITNAMLRNMGFNDPSRVRLYGYGGNLLDESLQNLPPTQLPECPVMQVSDGLLFYGKGTLHWSASTNRRHFIRHQNFYARAGYYFLTESETARPPIETLDNSDLPAPLITVNTFQDRALYEVDGFNWAASGRELYDSYNYAAGNKKAYSFNTTGATDADGYITVDFSTRHTAGTTLDVSHNNTTLGTLSLRGLNPDGSYYNYYKATTAQATYSIGGVNSQQTTITLTHQRPTGVPGRLNYLALTYTRQLQLYGSQTSFRSLEALGKSSVKYAIAAPNRTVVWDITDNIVSCPLSTESGEAMSFTAENTTLHEYIAFDPNGSFPTPTVVGSVANQNIHGWEQPDMVIVIPTSAPWRAEAEQLAQAHREVDGMTVYVVTANEVYNEFSSGTPDATAYRRMMKVFYDRTEQTGKAPRYLLMMGDCAYDNRMLTDEWKRYSPDDFLLCYESTNSVSEIDSYVTDDYLAMLDVGEGTNVSAGRMDIGVGRFPIRTRAEAQATVNKTLNYLYNRSAGAWKNRIVFAADDEENRQSNLFMESAEQLSKEIERDYPNFVVTRLFQDAYTRQSTAAGYTYPQATERLLSLIDEGLLMLNYTGHGGTNGWSAEFLLTGQLIRAMRNERQGLWITATCDFARYDDTQTTAGEHAFLNPNGGASALFTTSRTVFSSNNDRLNRAFNKHLLARNADGSRMRLGDIMRLAKNDAQLSNDINKLNFALLGDPALPLAYPEGEITVDEISNNTLQAGGIVTISGHADNIVNGTIALSVYDTKEHVVCKNNAHSGTDVPAFEFDQYNRRLFIGTDSVRNGQWSITFRIPLDISYSNAAGMFNFYATDGTNEAQGSYTDFIIGGTAPDALETDSLGPEITLFLNSPESAAQQTVNSTPVLYAYIHDEEGINAASVGIGHDITLRIVNVENNTIYKTILNEYFQTAIGDYRRGSLQFQLPQLNNGKYTLYLTVCDTKNNATTVAHQFTVDSEADIHATAFNVESNGADCRVSFLHDRPLYPLETTFEVFTPSGMLAYSSTITTTTENQFIHTYSTNLPSGMYICRIRSKEQIIGNSKVIISK